ncbi:MAG: DUF4123 domain-containing protein [Deltaproteobacteria bacterium]|nr:DUF4123 domain-containing protein [Deltaproteobacteria bacterium]
MSEEQEKTASSDSAESPDKQDHNEPAGRLTALLTGFKPDPDNFLYAILDPARSTQVLSGLHQFHPPAANLYQGQALEKMVDVTPTLVALEPGSKFMNWLLAEGFGQSWGVFLVSPGNLKELGAHFRSLVHIWAPDGRRMYFRYYDPRVLPVFLTCSTAAELAHFFGPVKHFIFESAGLSGLTACAWENPRLTRSDLPLDPDVVPPEPLICQSAIDSDQPFLAEDGALILRPEQMEIFAKYARSAFEGRLMDHLKEVYPEKTFGLQPEEFRGRVCQGLDRALAYGLTGETAAAAYVGWNFELGMDFEHQAEYARIGTILNDPELEPEVKVRRVESFLRGADIPEAGTEDVAHLKDEQE